MKPVIPYVDLRRLLEVEKQKKASGPAAVRSAPVEGLPHGQRPEVSTYGTGKATGPPLHILVSPSWPCERPGSSERLGFSSYKLQCAGTGCQPLLLAVLHAQRLTSCIGGGCCSRWSTPQLCCLHLTHIKCLASRYMSITINSVF